MELCVSSWSFHSLFLNGILTPESFIQLVRSYFGLKAVEFFEGDLCDSVHTISPEVLDFLARTHEKHGVVVSSISAKNDLTVEDDEAAAKDAESLKHWIEIAPQIGCRVIRINTGLATPDQSSLARLGNRIRPLLKTAADSGVTLAIENHPHPIRTRAQLGELLQLAKSLSRQGLRTCPDNGSFGGEFAGHAGVEAFGQLTRYAGHVHLKAPPDPAVADDYAAYYEPYVASLRQHGYEGFLSLQFVETADRRLDPLTETWNAYRAIGKIIGASLAGIAPSVDEIQGSSAHRTSKRLIPDKPVELATNILPLIVEGCRQRIGAKTKLRTFVEPADYASHDWAHSCNTTVPEAGPNSTFCAIVQQDPKAAKVCEQFYDEQFAKIRDQSIEERRICCCPLGLMMLFQPVASESHLYGGLSCGAWREPGTEGEILYGLDHFVTRDDIRRHAEAALLRIPELTSDGLEKAAQTFAEVVRDLDRYYELAYHEAATKREEFIRQHLADQLRQAPFASLNSAAGQLKPILKTLAEVLAYEVAAVYVAERGEGFDELGFERFASSIKNESSLPDDFTIPTSLFSERTSLFDDQEVKEAFDKAGIVPESHQFLELTATRVALFFVTGTHVDADKNHRILERIWHEIRHALRYAAMLDEAHETTERIQLLAETARHSINAPLQGVGAALGRLKSLIEQGEKPDRSLFTVSRRARDFLDEAATAVDRLSAASLRARIVLRERRQFRTYRIGPIIKSAANPLKMAGRERGIKIEIDQKVHELPRIECDREQIRLLFSNLVENAVKYSHSSKSVRILGELLSNHGAAGTDRVRITVQDFGLGIPEEYYEKIFERYVQVPTGDTKRPIGGTGLGLFICREIVEGHGGQITVSCAIPSWKWGLPHSERLQGCTVEFVVTLPVGQPKVKE